MLDASKMYREALVKWTNKRPLAQADVSRDQIQHETESVQPVPELSRSDMGRALIHDAQQTDALGKVLRYETSLTNSIARTMSILISLQTTRLAPEQADKEILIRDPVPR
jgi:hypothetical protein